MAAPTTVQAVASILESYRVGGSAPCLRRLWLRPGGAGPGRAGKQCNALR